jgi:hypothetical protein
MKKLSATPGEVPDDPGGPPPADRAAVPLSSSITPDGTDKATGPLLGGVTPDGRPLTQGDLVLIRMAARREWGLGRSLRKRLVKEMAAILRHGPTARDKVAAARTLVLCDSIDARREATAARSSDVQTLAGVRALQSVLQSPEGRQALADLSARLLSPPPPAEASDVGGAGLL